MTQSSRENYKLLQIFLFNEHTHPLYELSKPFGRVVQTLWTSRPKQLDESQRKGEVV